MLSVLQRTDEAAAVSVLETLPVTGVHIMPTVAVVFIEVSEQPLGVCAVAVVERSRASVFECSSRMLLHVGITDYR